MDYKSCPACGMQNSLEARFCVNCGTAIPEKGETETKKTCAVCGSAVSGDSYYCGNCGMPIEEPKLSRAEDQREQERTQPAARQWAPPSYDTGYYQQTRPMVVETPPEKGSQYEQISTWGYVGILLLLNIPFIGFVLSIIWASGACQKLAKRNLARAYLLVLLIGIIIGIIFLAAFWGEIRSSYNNYGAYDGYGGFGGYGGFVY